MFSTAHNPLESRRRRSPDTAVSLPVLLAVAAWIVGCGTPSGDTIGQEGVATPAHLILITVSDLRVDVDHPLLADALSAYAPSSLAVQSAASIFTGRLPSRAGAIGLDEAQPPPAAATLPVWLRQSGYSTAWFSQADWGARDGFTRGVDWVETAPESGWTASDVADRFGRALDDLLATGKPPAFVATHLDAPLQPTAEDFDSGRASAQWREDYIERATTILDAAQGMVDLVQAAAQSADRPIVLVLAGLSGFELADVDSGIGSGWTMHEAAIRVPLLARLYDSGSPEPLFGGTAPTLPPSLVDLTPTLLTFSGAAEPAEDEQPFDGTSWAEITDARATWTLSPRQQPRIAELVVRERNIARAVIDEDQQGLIKFVRAARRVPVEDRPALMRGYEEIQAAMLSGATPTPELFGPAEVEVTYRLQDQDGGRVPMQVVDTTNEAAYRPLRAALRRYAELTARTGHQPLALTRRLEIDPDQMRELESLGYL